MHVYISQEAVAGLRDPILIEASKCVCACVSYVSQEAVAGLRHRILIEASKGPVRWFEVPSSSFTVGRAKENQVCLAGDDFSHVSRTRMNVFMFVNESVSGSSAVNIWFVE